MTAWRASERLPKSGSPFSMELECPVDSQQPSSQLQGTGISVRNSVTVSALCVACHAKSQCTV